MPPTPASSTEIKGQDHSNKLSSLQLTFELPPSAITSHDVSKSSSSIGTKMSPISPTTSKPPYLQPSETVKARRRSSAANQQKETFALPPPPTRSRKIIQMKPRSQDEEAVVALSPAKGGTVIAGSSNAKSTAGSTASSKTATTKKQPSATSAAGRKIARKTAHSLIERRRRSKMNEEFAVLKGLIPACTGEMHKLAILQASIEYVRYLEDCITKLKAQQTRECSHSPTPAPASFRPAATSRASSIEGWNSNSKTNSEAGEDIDGDVEMTDSETPCPSPPTFTTSTPTPTPASHSSASPVQHPEYAYAPAHGEASPPSGYAYLGQQQSGSRLTSPGLRPQQLAIDHEVSAALLMLGGGGGGRGSASSAGAGSARGMSVRDLLSS
ncbi:hypothetical protein FHL15_005390 [Xylaria flabelliformis]|uniref:BHLH domain-containing protein n=1 Tax=Xylaria flabelliformis TaxID=2512241 RepID=A0A553I0I3_9PEZI|nr:hypothetical protein FHL15_005390 [Xylaria flabelliformis]